MDTGRGVDGDMDKGVDKGAATEVGAWSWPSEISETMFEGDWARVVVRVRRRRVRVRVRGGRRWGILVVLLRWVGGGGRDGREKREEGEGGGKRRRTRTKEGKREVKERLRGR